MDNLPASFYEPDDHEYTDELVEEALRRELEQMQEDKELVSFLLTFQDIIQTLTDDPSLWSDIAKRIHDMRIDRMAPL